jgi:hypothetical protein
VTGIDLQSIVNRAVNGGDEQLELMAAALGVRALPAAGPRSWWRDRLRFLASATVTTLRQARRAAPELSSPVGVCFPGNGDARAREVRTFFVRHHFGVESDCVGRGAQRRPRRRPSAAWWLWWARGVGWALLGLADWSERRYAWLGGALVDLQLFKRLEGELDQIYLFALYDRRQYLLLTFLARHTRVTATAVYQNIPLARNCRHLHVEVPVVLTSKVNLSEVDYYRAQGSFRPLSVTYAGQEYALDTHDLAPHAPLYDIGYYSSGEWARREGLYQVGPGDLARVRRGDFADNPYARAAAAQLAALVAYARGEQRTLRIYPHPLERGLLCEGVTPPYAALADGAAVSIDDGGRETSRRTVYDARVAVSLQSSFIWERLDLGLDESFLHEFADPAMNPFERAALGHYARNVCPSNDDLIAKVDAALRAR